MRVWHSGGYQMKMVANIKNLKRYEFSLKFHEHASVNILEIDQEMQILYQGQCCESTYY